MSILIRPKRGKGIMFENISSYHLRIKTRKLEESKLIDTEKGLIYVSCVSLFSIHLKE